MVMVLVMTLVVGTRLVTVVVGGVRVFVVTLVVGVLYRLRVVVTVVSLVTVVEAVVV